jgi:lysozyme
MRRWILVLVLLPMAACGPLDDDSSRSREHTTLDPYGTSQQALMICADGGTVQGVDVAHFQGAINWSSVKGDSRLFGFMKATEGLTYTDPTFATNWQQTQASGVYRGAYHFFRPQDDGVAQAQQFLSVAGTDFTGDLPPVVDFEVTDGVSNPVITQRLSDFLTTVRSQTGRTPMIYTAPAFWSGTVGNAAGFSQYSLWIANWGVTCPDVPGPWANWVFWQWTNSDTVTGIGGTVDGDYFNGTLSGLIGLIDGGPVSPPDAGSAPDAGSGGRDAGATPPDAGNPPPDAGSPAPDSGTGQADAGPADAGAVTPDAGRQAPDAGRASPDAGGTSTTGNGGCGCSGTASNVPGFLALVAVMWVRKRRGPFFLRRASG